MPFNVGATCVYAPSSFRNFTSNQCLVLKIRSLAPEGDVSFPLGKVYEAFAQQQFDPQSGKTLVKHVKKRCSL